MKKGLSECTEKSTLSRSAKRTETNAGNARGRARTLLSELESSRYGSTDGIYDEQLG